MTTKSTASSTTAAARTTSSTTKPSLPWTNSSPASATLRNNTNRSVSEGLGAPTKARAKLLLLPWGRTVSFVLAGGLYIDSKRRVNTVQFIRFLFLPRIVLVNSASKSILRLIEKGSEFSVGLIIFRQLTQVFG